MDKKRRHNNEGRVYMLELNMMQRIFLFQLLVRIICMLMFIRTIISYIFSNFSWSLLRVGTQKCWSLEQFRNIWRLHKNTAFRMFARWTSFLQLDSSIWCTWSIILSSKWKQKFNDHCLKGAGGRENFRPKISMFWYHQTIL